MTSRLISSGMLRSKLRNPASTCASVLCQKSVNTVVTVVAEGPRRCCAVFRKILVAQDSAGLDGKQLIV